MYFTLCLCFLASVGIEIVAAALFCGTSKLYGVYGTGADAGQTMGAAAVPFGHSIFNGDIGKGTELSAFSAADAVILYMEFFVPCPIFGEVGSELCWESLKAGGTVGVANGHAVLDETTGTLYLGGSCTDNAKRLIVRRRVIKNDVVIRHYNRAAALEVETHTAAECLSLFSCGSRWVP